MSAAVRARGPAGVRGALELLMLSVFGPGYAEVTRVQVAMLLVPAPAHVSRTRSALIAGSHSKEEHFP